MNDHEHLDIFALICQGLEKSIRKEKLVAVMSKYTVLNKGTVFILPFLLAYF